MSMGGGKMSIRALCADYKAEMVFGSVLLVCIGLSTWLGKYIPLNFYVNVIGPILNGCITTVCLSGAWLMARHTDGMNIRKVWVAVLLIYAFFTVLLLMRVTSFVDAPKQGMMALQGWEMVVGDFLLWLFLLYIAATLRPGWITVSRALLHGTPVFVAFALDLLFDFDFRALLALYPIILFGFLVEHIAKYRKYCEENYSSMDHIDTQWIVRYIIMYLIDGALFFTLCFVASVPVAFTQQWLLLFMLIYSTEQTLYRENPWDNMRTHHALHHVHHPMPHTEVPDEDEDESTEVQAPDPIYAEYRQNLEKWMEEEKPYLSPEFRLMDIREVVPLNRTYLSQFINAEYGCTFYQFVTNYRISAAKQMLEDHPEMKIQDVAEECGFSSPVVFSRVFARETGVSPSEWHS